MSPALLLILPALAAEADDGETRTRPSLALTEDAEVRYYVGEAVEDPYLEQVTRTNLVASGSSWSAGVQLDQVWVAGTAYTDAFGIETQAVDLLAPEIRFPLETAYVNAEKLYFTARRDLIQVTLGDGYATFGRGIALNVARRTDIDVDTSLFGVRMSADVERWSFQMVTGLTNPQQVSQDFRNSEIDPGLAHAVTGVRAEAWGVGPLNLGAHAVMFSLAARNDFGRDWARYGSVPTAAVAGVNVGAAPFGGNAEVYAELDRLVPIADVEREDPLQPGWAAYASIAAYPGSVVLLAEAKHYVEMEDINRLALSDGYELLTPPTLEYERAITEDSSATVNSSDVSGARVRADWILIPGRTIPHLSVAAYRDRALDDGLHFNQTPETILHPVIGVQQFGVGDQAGFHAFVNTGLRIDTRDEGADGTDYGRDVQLHADLDIGPWPAHRGFEVAIAVERFLWGTNTFQQEDYTELEGAVSWHPAERVVVAAYLDYSDNPLISGGAFGSAGNLSENLYGALELQAKPSSKVTVKAFYGAYKAGIRCAGGQCKQLPAFEGGRVSVNFAL